jgi:hypothetical protein
MSDEKEKSDSDQKHDEIRAEAKSLLNEIKKIKTQAEEYLKSAEVSRKQTDEHASYAYQAKVNTEEHSKATASFKGIAEADQNTIAANKQKSDELLAALTRGKADIDADAKAIGERRKEVDQSTEELVKNAKGGAVYLQETENYKKTTETYLKTTEQYRDKASQASQKTEVAQNRTEGFATQSSNLVAKITDTNKICTDMSARINELSNNATADEENLKEILEKLIKSHATASEYETRVAKSSADLESLIKRTECLLPGVTSASLASAFATQKKRFTDPKKWWLIVFGLCMFFLCLVALPGFIAAISDNLSNKTWTDIFRSLIMRLPIVIPLVWLAIYAGRNYMLSVRLEEDYAYKEAISMAFEGYKREMEKIAGDQPAGQNNPITTLCVNVLKAIAERPGRIYEGKQKDITLQNEALEAFKNAADYSKKQIAED